MKYYVAYTANGYFASTTVTTDREITTSADISELHQLIADSEQLDSVVVINWVKLDA